MEPCGTIRKISCACGCGNVRPAVDSRGRSRLYLKGHTPKEMRTGPTKTKCRLAICDRVEIPRNGMCNLHYRRWKRCGDPLFVAPSATLVHGHARVGLITPEYRSWQGMISRCSNPNTKDYSDYGARGISVCERWLNSFENFLADMGRKPSPQHSIDRYPDNNGNYKPDNCRWATPIEQNRNSRHNRIVTIGKESHPLSVWAEILNLNYSVIQSRYAKGRDIATGART